MTAADSIERAERRAAVLRSSSSVARWIAVLLLVIFAYWRGRVDASHAAPTVNRFAQRDTIVVDSIRVDTVRVRVAETKAIAARASFEAPDAPAAVVEAVADTAAAVPVSTVLPDIQTCKDMRDGDLEQLDILKVTVRDLEADIDLETQRADLAEQHAQQLASDLAQHRHGFKAGAITGATAVVVTTVAVIHFVRILR